MPERQSHKRIVRRSIDKVQTTAVESHKKSHKNSTFEQAADAPTLSWRELCQL